jgi:hypothetical protein
VSQIGTCRSAGRAKRLLAFARSAGDGDAFDPTITRRLIER